MLAIKTTNLTKKYKDVIAVNNINLEIETGELFALLGINGAGKTTLIKMLTTLTPPTSGDAILLENSILKDQNKIKTYIDVSMQETAIARNLTVSENIEFYCGLNGQSKQQTEETKKWLFKIFEFENIADKRASKLSGGWQRKLSIALALASKPKILFLDEPTLGLDVIARRELWKLIKSLKSQMTIILTTHYMEEAEELADRIGIMKSGKLLFVGTKKELFRNTNEKNVEDAFIQIVEGDKNEAVT